MYSVGSLHIRRSLPDYRIKQDDGRFAGFGLCFFYKLHNPGNIVSAACQGLPVVCFVSFQHIFGKGDIGRSVDGNMIGIVENDELTKPEMSSQ